VCWFNLVTPCAPKKTARLFLSNTYTRWPNSREKYLQTSDPINPDEPVTRSVFMNLSQEPSIFPRGLNLQFACAAQHPLKLPSLVISTLSLSCIFLNLVVRTSAFRYSTNEAQILADLLNS